MCLPFEGTQDLYECGGMVQMTACPEPSSKHSAALACPACGGCCVSGCVPDLHLRQARDIFIPVQDDGGVAALAGVQLTLADQLVKLGSPERQFRKPVPHRSPSRLLFLRFRMHRLASFMNRKCSLVHLAE